MVDWDCGQATDLIQGGRDGQVGVLQLARPHHLHRGVVSAGERIEGDGLDGPAALKGWSTLSSNLHLVSLAQPTVLR